MFVHGDEQQQQKVAAELSNSSRATVLRVFEGMDARLTIGNQIVPGSPSTLHALPACKTFHQHRIATVCVLAGDLDPSDPKFRLWGSSSWRLTRSVVGCLRSSSTQVGLALHSSPNVSFVYRLSLMSQFLFTFNSITRADFREMGNLL